MNTKCEFRNLAQWAWLASLQNFADLANLVTLNLPMEILQIHEVFAVLKDNMTAATLPLSKAKFQEQVCHRSGCSHRFGHSSLFREFCRLYSRGFYLAMQTFFGSVKKRNASSPPSRPTPLCFIPPKGTRRSRRSQQFTQTVPVLIL